MLRGRKKYLPYLPDLCDLKEYDLVKTSQEYVLQLFKALLDAVLWEA